MKFSQAHTLAAALLTLTIAPSTLAQQSTPRPLQTTQPGEARPGQTAPTPSTVTTGQQRRADGTALPQGFSVVLVLGDIQGTSAADDVPPAARKALVDMREFLPFKSYKLLDAAWLMCCGQDPRVTTLARSASSGTSGRSAISQLLRGPDEQEYVLHLSTSRAENSQVFVRFSLTGGGTFGEGSMEASTGNSRTLARRNADLKDRRQLIEKQAQDARKKTEVGVAPASEAEKLELELRRIDREIEEVSAKVAEERAGRMVARTSGEHASRSSIMDTSFTMHVGETVVVGTSRLKGGSKALIALLTAVPPRTTR